MMTDIVKVALISGICGAAPAMGALILGLLNRAKLHEVDQKVDGQLDKLVTVEKKISFGEGSKDATDRANDGDLKFAAGVQAEKERSSALHQT